jgi:hypothetical protein
MLVCDIACYIGEKTAFLIKYLIILPADFASGDRVDIMRSRMLAADRPSAEFAG